MSDHRKELMVLTHKCPVCKYQTKETYLKETSHLVVKGTDIVHFSFKKEENDKEPFDRFECCGRVTISCPKCGVLLAGDVCETLLGLTDYNGE